MYNWGIIGTSAIAKEMCEALKDVNGTVYGVSGSSLKKAEDFAEAQSVLHAYATSEDMMSDPNIDVVYIATPHHLHYELIMHALDEGKHVLCEKAITVNSKQAEKAKKLAKEKGLILSEAMTIYHMPIMKELKQLVSSGQLGKLRTIQVNFGSFKEYDPAHRFFNKEKAGGALLDIGVYAMAFTRFFLSSQPNISFSTVNYFETGTDADSSIVLKNEEGELVTIILSMRAKMPKRAVIGCEKGFIEVSNYPRANEATITYTNDGHSETLTSGEVEKAMSYEIQDMETYIDTDGKDNPLSISVDVMKSLDAIRNQWGFVYPFEEA